MACEITNYLQSFIFCLNDEKVRTSIIQKSLEQTTPAEYTWLGTWYVRDNNENKTQSQKKLVISKPCSFGQKLDTPLIDLVKEKSHEFNKGSRFKFFTVCIFYNISSVHYVAFLYNREKKQLISFDPGVELYHHGMKTIVPCLRNIFYKNQLINEPFVSQDRFSLGRCHAFTFKGKKYGIQYNGKDIDFPADAFCQTWTLYFFDQLLQSKDYDFLTDWCKFNPKYRVVFLLNSFIIPILKFNPLVRKEYFKDLQDQEHQVMKCFQQYTIQRLQGQK